MRDTIILLTYLLVTSDMVSQSVPPPAARQTRTSDCPGDTNVSSDGGGAHVGGTAVAPPAAAATAPAAGAATPTATTAAGRQRNSRR